MFESQNLCHEQGEVSVSGFTSNGKDQQPSPSEEVNILQCTVNTEWPQLHIEAKHGTSMTARPLIFKSLCPKKLGFLSVVKVKSMTKKKIRIPSSSEVNEQKKIWISTSSQGEVNDQQHQQE